MRNIGVFTSNPVESIELVQFLAEYSSTMDQPLSRREHETVIGREPDLLYVFDRTSLEDEYFDPNDLEQVQTKLGTTPRSYVNVHFTSTEAAAALAEAVAGEITRKWGGVIDYTGAGGQVGVRPTPSR